MISPRLTAPGTRVGLSVQARKSACAVGVSLAQRSSFGGYGATVEKTADFMPAFEAAQKSGKPAIIHLKVDAEALLPTISLTATREKAQAGG